MLYRYNHTEGDLAKLHQYIEHFFSSLFRVGSFDEAQLFHADFLDLAKASKKRLYKPLKLIADKYEALDDPNKEIVKRAFVKNNQIDGLCIGNEEPVLNDDLPDSISTNIRDFFIALWEGYPQNKKLGVNCGTVKEHFNLFCQTYNPKAEICPFCGISPLKSEYDKGRNAYDHYLPKDKYPFNSFNLFNLVPICDECNSAENKGAEDPLKHKETLERRKVFYPYETLPAPNQITVMVQASHDSDLKNQDDWKVEIEDEAKEWGSEIKSWDQIFGIKGRYKARINKRERYWKDEYILKQYRREKRKAEKRSESVDLDEFKNDLLEDFDSFEQIPMGILQKAYCEYFFANPELENNLNQ